MKAEHTKGLLERNAIKGWELWIGADYHIADVHGQLGVRRANALRMITCWNSHEKLLKACRAAQRFLDDLYNDYTPAPIEPNSNSGLDWDTRYLLQDAIAEATKGSEQC